MSDSGFAQVQSAGPCRHGRRSVHLVLFDLLPDGGRISLQRDSDALGNFAQIYRHMRHRGRVSRAIFIPGSCTIKKVPAPCCMSNRSHIRYTADTLPGGGEVRLQSSDSATSPAIHEFLAFFSVTTTDHQHAPHSEVTRYYCRCVLSSIRTQLRREMNVSGRHLLRCRDFRT